MFQLQIQLFIWNFIPVNKMLGSFLNVKFCSFKLTNKKFDVAENVTKFSQVAVNKHF